MAILVALLIIVPLLELWVIIEIGTLIGAWPTIAILLACSVAGAMLVKRESRSAWLRFTDVINSGRVPAKETADGALIVIAGALLLTPGFLTDFCGLMLLLPPVRAAVRNFALARVAGGGLKGFAFSAAASTASKVKNSRQATSREYDFEGVVIEADPAKLDRPVGDQPTD